MTREENRYAQELSVALDLATVGGELALDGFGAAVSRTRKSDGSWVTEVDKAVETEIRSGLARLFPDHNIWGEEEGLKSAGGGEPSPGAPTWIVDPIDGTHNYMAGIPVWAILIALRVEDRSVLGVVHAPALNETYDALDGAGARFNGKPMRVSDSDWDEATLVFSNWEGFSHAGMKSGFTSLADKAWRVRGFGDFWGHMLVARGAAEVMVEPELSLWDVAALEPIVRQAGGRITGIDGAPWKKGPLITTNGALHARTLELLRAQDA